jgi:hypothetical protein
MVPHLLPDEHKLQSLVADLPLKIVNFIDEEDFYLAKLQIPSLYSLEDGPMSLQVGDPLQQGFHCGSVFLMSNPPEVVVTYLWYE